jgi:multidrug resistance efflux pump
MSNQKWVVANYKETQVEKMVEGQKVEIEIDAYPDQKSGNHQFIFSRNRFCICIASTG